MQSFIQVFHPSKDIFSCLCENAGSKDPKKRFGIVCVIQWAIDNFGVGCSALLPFIPSLVPLLDDQALYVSQEAFKLFNSMYPFVGSDLMPIIKTGRIRPRIIKEINKSFLSRSLPSNVNKWGQKEGLTDSKHEEAPVITEPVIDEPVELRPLSPAITQQASVMKSPEPTSRPVASAEAVSAFDLGFNTPFVEQPRKIVVTLAMNEKTLIKELEKIKENIDDKNKDWMKKIIND